MKAVYIVAAVVVLAIVLFAGNVGGLAILANLYLGWMGLAVFAVVVGYIIFRAK